jgi:hypothetical protein
MHGSVRAQELLDRDEETADREIDLGRALVKLGVRSRRHPGDAMQMTAGSGVVER